MKKQFSKIVSQFKSVLNQEFLDAGESVHGRSVKEQIEDLSPDAAQHLRDLEILKDAKQHQLDDCPENRAFVEGLGGEEAYWVSFLGKGKYKAALKSAERNHTRLHVFKAPAKEPEDGLSESQKTWLETRTRPGIDSSVQYILEDGSSRKYAYDGDMEVDPQVGADEQESLSFIIPYKRDEDGEVIVSGTYKVMQVYISKAADLPLPRGKQPKLVQDLLTELAGSADWDKFQAVLSMFRQYRNAMKDRDVSVRTMRNGLRFVYYLPMGQVVLWSPIVHSELAPAAKAEVELRWALKQEGEELLKLSSQLEGDREAYKGLQVRFWEFVSQVREAQTWWLWKPFVAPLMGLYRREVSAEDLGL